MTRYPSVSVRESGCYDLLPAGPAEPGVAKGAAVTSGSADGSYNYACLDTFSQLPATGALTIILPSMNPTYYEEGALAGRKLHVLERRKSATTISTINARKLATAAGQSIATSLYLSM